ncbi:hypothetical protein K2173_001912 [Erythroxylum novogranatense]|uniref:Uncharacterized protein n=1 Tax=Erythroxylum novogranatense TaxID=1862640 RepID=A0AAV8SPX9_9ROSI|nr:hypothetical protein K2173_001912 [Erythroxylum novogranatense]
MSSCSWNRSGMFRLQVKGGARSDVVARSPWALDEEARFLCGTSPFGPVGPFLGLGPGPWDLKWKLVGVREAKPITGPKCCWWPSPLEEDARELASAVPTCVSSALASFRVTYLEPNFGGDVWEQAWEEGRWNRACGGDRWEGGRRVLWTWTQGLKLGETLLPTPTSAAGQGRQSRRCYKGGPRSQKVRGGDADKSPSSGPPCYTGNTVAAALRTAPA